MEKVGVNLSSGACRLGYVIVFEECDWGFEEALLPMPKLITTAAESASSGTMASTSDRPGQSPAAWDFVLLSSKDGACALPAMTKVSGRDLGSSCPRAPKLALGRRGVAELAIKSTVTSPIRP